MDVADQLRELAGQRSDGEKMISVIERTARVAGLSYSRCFEIWYRRARRIEPAEVARISEALKQKQARDARNELSELRLRLARLEALLSISDPDFHRPALGALQQQMRRSR